MLGHVMGSTVKETLTIMGIAGWSRSFVWTLCLYREFSDLKNRKWVKLITGRGCP